MTPLQVHRKYHQSKIIRVHPSTCNARMSVIGPGTWAPYGLLWQCIVQPAATAYHQDPIDFQLWRPIAQPLHDYLYLYITWKLVRTIVLSRHGSNLNLTRSVIIHDVIHSLMCMLSTPHCGFSGVSPDGNCTYVH